MLYISGGGDSHGEDSWSKRQNSKAEGEKSAELHIFDVERMIWWLEVELVGTGGDARTFIGLQLSSRPNGCGSSERFQQVARTLKCPARITILIEIIVAMVQHKRSYLRRARRTALTVLVTFAD